MRLTCLVSNKQKKPEKQQHSHSYRVIRILGNITILNLFLGHNTKTMIKLNDFMIFGIVSYRVIRFLGNITILNLFLGDNTKTMITLYDLRFLVLYRDVYIFLK